MVVLTRESNTEPRRSGWWWWCVVWVGVWERREEGGREGVSTTFKGFTGWRGVGVGGGGRRVGRVEEGDPACGCVSRCIVCTGCGSVQATVSCRCVLCVFVRGAVRCVTVRSQP